jgi:C4-dicarboxylate-binding protein DctP
MNLNKKELAVAAALVVMLLITSLVACGGQTQETGSEVTESFDIVIGSGHARTHVYVAMLEDWFVPELTKRAAEMGYEINVTEGYGGTISAAADICESVESGLLGMGGLSFLTEADKFAL